MSERTFTPPVTNPSREVRIALVLYGGVSLAIYIYGVAYEFWRLVQASRGVKKNAYTPLLERVNVTAAVDIVSGASAGGINGILLGKALATGGNLESCRTLWVDDGDLAQLLRDPGEREPRSLLRSQLFDDLLRRGLEAMEVDGRGSPALADVLDVFAPGTRVRSWNRTYRDDFGDDIETREYRKVFQLKLRKKGADYIPDTDLGYDRNDFTDNAALLSVARSTSAFPFAFEPKLVERRSEKDPLFTPGEPDATYFSDGGILHNRPFSEAIDTIVGRPADRPVSRWLLSVEPDPEHLEAQADPGLAPDVTEVVGKALVGIPRYESIAADLERLRAHKDKVARVRAAIHEVDVAAGASVLASHAAPESEGAPLSLDTLIEAQVAYPAYTKLRISRLRDRFVARLRACAGLTESEEPGIEAAVATLPDEELGALDVEYERRRAYRLLDLVGQASEALSADKRDELSTLHWALWATFDRANMAMWDAFGPDSAAAHALRGLEGAEYARISDAMLGALPGIVQTLTTAKTELAAAVLKATSSPEAERVAELLESSGVLNPAPPLDVVAANYELWDMLLYPLEDFAETGSLENVLFARISPQDARFIEKPSADKLAGDALGHFGGFVKQSWRRNDILWGRLDAADTIVRVLLEGRQDELRVEHTRSVQAEIVESESVDTKGRDYKAYLEQEYRVGAESLADVPLADRASLAMQGADVLRNMLRRLERADGQGGAAGKGTRVLLGSLGKAVGFGLFLVRWPVRAVFGRDLLVRRAATLVVLFGAVWAIAMLLLFAFGLIGSLANSVWTAIVVALLVFVVYAALLSIAARAVRVSRARHGPPA